MRLPRSIDKPLRQSLRHPLVRRVLFAAAATWTLAALTGLAYTLPAAHRYDAVSAKLATLTQELVDADRQQAISQLYRKATKELPGIDRRLRSPLRQTTLLAKVRQLAQRERVAIAGQSFRDGEPYENWSVIDQDISLSGSYAGLTGFIAGLDRLPTWTLVGELRIERARTRGHVDATLHLLTYGGGQREFARRDVQ